LKKAEGAENELDWTGRSTGGRGRRGGEELVKCREGRAVHLKFFRQYELRALQARRGCIFGRGKGAEFLNFEGILANPR